MENYLSILKESPIFKSLDETFILHIITALRGHRKEFIKNEIIYHYGENIQYAGIVLEGVVSETMINSCDNQYGVTNYKQGDIFGIAYSLFSSEKPFVQFISSNNSCVLFLNFSSLINKSNCHCCKISQLISNLLLESYKDNIVQSQNIQILIQKRIRSKLVTYLSNLKRKNNIITLPLNRQELANHLAVERSALSRELCRMKKDGLITFEKNQICILKNSLLDLG